MTNLGGLISFCCIIIVLAIILKALCKLHVEDLHDSYMVIVRFSKIRRIISHNESMDDKANIIWWSLIDKVYRYNLKPSSFKVKVTLHNLIDKKFNNYYDPIIICKYHHENVDYYNIPELVYKYRTLPEELEESFCEKLNNFACNYFINKEINNDFDIKDFEKEAIYFIDKACYFIKLDSVKAPEGVRVDGMVNPY